jgi:soluble lytic murein transglycosylase-like protein
MTIYKLLKAAFVAGIFVAFNAGIVPAMAESVSEDRSALDPSYAVLAGASGARRNAITVPDGRQDIGRLIEQAARAEGVPVLLAHAVVRVESNYNPRVRGQAGEIGLMQIKPSTARAIGFSGPASALYDPATNLLWGMRYLAGARELAGGDICGTILRYNAGHGARRMNPISARYCRKVQTFLDQQGRTQSAGL